MRKQLNVGYLRPPEAALSAAWRTFLTELVETHEVSDAKKGGMLMDETTNKLLRDLLEITEEVAEDVRVSMKLHEYQAHIHDDRTEVAFSTRNMLDFLGNDLLLALDPTDAQSTAMLRGAAVNPLQRMVVAYSDSEDLYERGQFLSMQKFPVFGEQAGTRTALQRVFFIHLSPDDNRRANDFQHAKFIVRQAFLYPHSELQRVSGDRRTALYDPR